MITFVNNENILSLANGNNFIKASDFKSEDLYCLNGISFCENLGTEILDSYEITLSDGSKFISSEPYVKIKRFYSYMKPYSRTKIRYINSYSEIKNSQRNLMYNYKNNSRENYIIPININEKDLISNLLSVTHSEYKNFLVENSYKKSGFFLLNQIYKEKYGVGYSYGQNNGLFTGISNLELVNLCKEEYKKNSSVKNIRELLRMLSKNGHPIPKSFSKYRFGGNKEGYTNLQNIVFNNLDYVDESTKVKNDFLKELRILETQRKQYLKNFIPKVVSSKYIGTSLFHKIKSESPISIITKNEDNLYNNCTGVYLC